MPTTPEKPERREFLECAALGAAGFLLTCRSAHTAGAPSQRTAAPGPAARFATFQSLAPGDVSPEGWLKLYLQKQSGALGSHLPQVSWPFTGAYWSGEEAPPENDPTGWPPWEQKAYWIDGALRCALALGDEPLRRAALVALDYTLGHVLPDGYLGPTFARDAKGSSPAFDNFRWPHTVFFRALAAYSEASNDERVPLALRRHYLADRGRAPYGGPSRDVTNIEGMLWAYEHTGDPELLAMAEKAWNEFLLSAPPGHYESGDLHPVRVFGNTPIHSHGVTYIEKAKLPAILYMHTGKPEYLRFALAAQERIFNHHMLVDGIPSTTEAYGETTPLDAHETCDISDHTWSWGYLLMATGDAKWADQIERACFNAGLGSIRKDWTGLQYFSCPNQVISTPESSHVPAALWPVGVGPALMTYRPNPGHETACCGGNVHRLFPNYVIRMWMTDKEGGLAATLYGASTVHATVGRSGESIEIREETYYPFDEEILFHFSSAKAVKFPLYLRIPGWCKTPRLLINGEVLQVPVMEKGFVRVERTFHPGDRLTLELPMQPSLSWWPKNGLAIERGPLVYALPIGEVWKPTVTPRWSTNEYPEWSAHPATDWNFSIGVSDTDLLSQLKIVRKQRSTDPWMDPPVSIHVPMRRVVGWDLWEDEKYPERKQTPPLPAPDAEFMDEWAKLGIENVALVPYGATQLRLTIFPNLGSLGW